MVNRKRNLNLHLMLTEEEKFLIKSVAEKREMLVTNLIIELVRKEKERIEQQ